MSCFNLCGLLLKRKEQIKYMNKHETTISEKKEMCEK